MPRPTASHTKYSSTEKRDLFPQPGYDDGGLQVLFCGDLICLCREEVFGFSAIRAKNKWCERTILDLDDALVVVPLLFFFFAFLPLCFSSSSFNFFSSSSSSFFCFFFFFFFFLLFSFFLLSPSSFFFRFFFSCNTAFPLFFLSLGA